LDYFDAIVIAQEDNGVHEKPHPGGIELCLQELGVDREHAFFVGNGNEDVLAAQQAGVVDIYIERGAYMLDGTHPAYTINTLYHMPGIITELFGQPR
jgi:phosphoglycolate phosphatase-like HAD superfamily hydrolase